MIDPNIITSAAVAFVSGIIGAGISLAWTAGRWRTVKDTGIWAYQENTRTGARRIKRVAYGLHQPRDLDWIERGGEVGAGPKSPPPSGGGTGRLPDKGGAGKKP